MYIYMYMYIYIPVKEQMGFYMRQATGSGHLHPHWCAIAFFLFYLLHTNTTHTPAKKTSRTTHTPSN